LSRPGRFRSWQLNTRKSISVRFHTSLPHKYQGVKRKPNNRKDYIPVYFGLSPKLTEKLKNTAEKQGKTESEVLRQILDVYLKDIEKKKLTYKPFRKLSPSGLKTLSRTIRKDQDKKLREIAGKTGRKISELVREAV